ncbi:hypothetical protein M9Y10_028844 [Tritrichomonas musculus]|uniref:Homeobox domain-containing protein n=1 Tax=Tritrichomonas musculus TaxID=1915356 RepID=A0ABR2KKM1_9EUKA
MIIPSFAPSSLPVSSNNNQSYSYAIQPKKFFLQSRSSDDTINSKSNSELLLNQNPIAFSTEKKTQECTYKRLLPQTDCNNVLITDYNFKNPVFKCDSIKRNKFHNYVFRDNPTEPIKVLMTKILEKVYPNEDQPCFIDADQEEKERQFFYSPIIPLNNYPEVLTPHLDQQNPNPIDDDIQKTINHKKQQFQQILIIQNNLKAPPAGTEQHTNKDNKPIKPRQNFTEDQRNILNSYLKTHCNNPYADSNDIARLVELTRLQPRQIRTYFTNKRMRDAKCMNLATAKRCRSLVSANKIFS